MEIIEVTNNANFARVKLGDIRPNRFRDLVRWPVERNVIDGLKQSINETGFWNNLQAIHNERNEVELRFGHHRWTAGLELFGPDYEVAVEMVPFQGEWSLLRALHMENAVNRNKVMHTHEVVAQLTRWWDDEVFEKYPSWDECEQAGLLSSLLLETYFGKAVENGKGNYVNCSRYGIGRAVISKMLDGTESEKSIRLALESLPLTERRKQGLELQAEEDRRKADEMRAEADRINAEREAEAKRQAEEDRKRQAEIDRAAAEQRKADAAAKSAKDAESKRVAEEQRQAAERRKQQLESEKAAKAESNRMTQEEKRKAAEKAESGARKSDCRAKQKEQVIESRDWFDAKAAEVFDRPSHGAAFRIMVSNDAIRPFLHTDDLLPFAQAVRDHLDRDEAAGRELTADRIRETVNDNFRTFRNGIKRGEKIRILEVEQENPVLLMQRKIASAEMAMRSAQEAIGSLLSEINNSRITGADFGLLGDQFDRSFTQLEKVIAEFNRLRKPKTA